MNNEYLLAEEDFGDLGAFGVQRIRGEALGNLLGFGSDGLKDS